MQLFLTFIAAAAGSFVAFLLYIIIGMLIAMDHVSDQKEYDTCDFIPVLMCWPSYLWHKFKGKPWNLGG